MRRWLETADNIDKWHDKICANERRILKTNWTGQAWKELQNDTSFLRKSFERTGCLMTIYICNTSLEINKLLFNAILTFPPVAL